MIAEQKDELYKSLYHINRKLRKRENQITK